MRVSVRDLQVTYRMPGGLSLPALGPLSFEVESGQFVAIVGPSGCGKSSLIRVLAGLQKPSSGNAYLGHQPIQEPSPAVGLMFQDSNLMPWRTVIDNIALPLELAGVPKLERRAQAADLIPQLGLEGFEESYPGELSGGMAQRVALGRVLIQRPEVLLLDEPFGALDALTREQISLDLLQLWQQSGATAIMVTHDIREAVLLADRVFVFSQRPGKLIADVHITLPRPRHSDDMFNEAFGDFVRQVRAAIDRA